MSLIPDILRAVADGLDQAAGRDPVDKAAEQARAALFTETREEGGEQTGCRGETAGRGLTTSGVPGPTDEPGSTDAPFFRPALMDRREQLRAQLAARLAEKNVWPQEPPDADVVELTGPVPDEETGIQLGLARQELRRFQKMYGKASRTIGEQRGTIARLDRERSQAQDQAAEMVSDAIVARDQAAEFEREVARLNEQLAEKPYRIDTGERVLHVRPGEGVLVEAVGATNAMAVRFREQLEERMPGVRFGVVKDVGQIQIITAAEQTVVDVARTLAGLFDGDGAESLTPDSELSKLVDAVHALDTAEADA